MNSYVQYKSIAAVSFEKQGKKHGDASTKKTKKDEKKKKNSHTPPWENNIKKKILEQSPTKELDLIVIPNAERVF